MMRYFIALLFALSAMAQNYSLNIIDGNMLVEEMSLSIRTFSDSEAPQIPGPQLFGTLGESLTLEITNLTDSEQFFSVSGLNLLPIDNGWPIDNIGIAPSQTLLFDVPTTKVGTFIYSATTDGALSIENGLFGMISIKNPSEAYSKILLAYEMDSSWHLGIDIDEYIYNPDLFYMNNTFLESDSTVNTGINSTGMSMNVECVNMGFEIHRYSFNDLSATIMAVDANDVLIPTDISSYLDVFPGERYTLSLSAHDEGSYGITLQFLDPFSQDARQTNQLFVHFQDYSASIGDINLDGHKDILDLVLMIDFILGEDTPNEAEFFRTDMNSDYQLTVQDIVLLVNLILNIL